MASAPRTYLHVEPALAALWVLTGAAYGAVLPFLTVYAARRGMTLTGIGVLGATAAGASALLQPALGRLVDRKGRRRTILAASMIVGAVGFVGLGNVTTAPLIVAFAALGTAGFYGSRVVIVALTVNAVHGAGHGAAVFARYRVLPSFGYTTMAVGGGLLLGRISFATLFTIGALLYLAAGLCGLALPAYGERQASTSAGAERAAPAISARRVLATLALMSLLFYVAGSSSDTYVPLLVRRLHGSFTQVGLVGTISAIAEIPLMIVVGSLADRGRRAALLAAGMATLPLRYALYAIVQTPVQLMGVQVLDGFSFSVYAVAGVSLLADQTPREVRAWALGIYSAAGTVGPIVGPLLAGVLAAHVGLQPMFGLVALGTIAVPLTIIVGLWPLLARRAGTATEAT